VRWVWVDAGNLPAYEKLQANGIDGTFFDPRDSRITRAQLLDVQARGYKVGIYAGAGWAELGTTPKDCAAKVDSWIRSLQQGVVVNDFPRVQFDLEMHDPEFILQTFRYHRTLHPWHSTSWALEPAQGGLFSPAFVTEVTTQLRIRICPQLFGGAMEPFDVDYVRDDLESRGWPRSSISLMHDASKLGRGWQGYAFTQGRLPS